MVFSHIFVEFLPSCDYNACRTKEQKMPDQKSKGPGPHSVRYEISDEAHRRLRIYAATRRLTMGEAVNELLENVDVEGLLAEQA